jgi:glycosyltransferase involved in cell wall biosynthesis
MAVGSAHRVLYRGIVARRRIIAVAPHVRVAALALGARPELVEVVPNGVDVERLHRVRAGVASHAGVRVGMLARFDPQKGLDVFLKSAARLRDTGATFVIGASGSAYPEHERRVRAEAERLSVDVIDPGDDGASFLAGLDIVLMPSLQAEGMPLTLLEAMALGKAIVASDVQGIGSIPGVADATLLVSSGDAGETAVAIRALIADPAARLAIGMRAAELVERRFPVDRVARAAADIVERSTT